MRSTHHARNPASPHRTELTVGQVASRAGVAVIKVAQRTGIPLAEIQAALSSLPENRTPTAADWKKLSARWREALDARIASLTRLRDQIDGCIGCGCLSLKVCPLRNPWDELGEEGPGARLLEAVD